MQRRPDIFLTRFRVKKTLVPPRASRTMEADMSAVELGKKCRDLLIKCVKDIGARGGGRNGEKRGLILSGGVDTCAIAEASLDAGVKYKCAITVLAGDPEAATDRPYAAMIAKVSSVRVHMVLHAVRSCLSQTPAAQ